MFINLIFVVKNVGYLTDINLPQTSFNLVCTAIAFVKSLFPGISKCLYPMKVFRIIL